jgi:hypothetical protein
MHLVLSSPKNSITKENIKIKGRKILMNNLSSYSEEVKNVGKIIIIKYINAVESIKGK